MGLTGRHLICTLTMFSLLASLTACARKTREVVVVPEQFRGPVVIVFGDPAGVTPTVTDGSRVLQVPHSGVLHVRGDKPARWTMTLRAGGQELPVHENASTQPDRLQGYLYENAVDGAIGDLPSVAYYTLIVGVPDEDAVGEVEERLLDLTEQAIEETRARITAR